MCICLSIVYVMQCIVQVTHIMLEIVWVEHITFFNSQYWPSFALSCQAVYSHSLGFYYGCTMHFCKIRDCMYFSHMLEMMPQHAFLQKLGKNGNWISMPTEIRNEYALLIKKSRGTKETCMADTEMKYRFHFIHNTLMTFSKAAHPLFPPVQIQPMWLCALHIFSTH